MRLAHQRHQPAHLVLLGRRKRRPVLDQPLELAGGGGVIVHALEVGGQAERRIASAAEPRGAEEAVFQGEVGQAAPARLASRRALESPAGQSVQPRRCGNAGRQELEPVAPAQETFEPPRLQGHADRAHAHAKGSRVGRGGEGRAGSI